MKYKYVAAQFYTIMDFMLITIKEIIMVFECALQQMLYVKSN